MIHLRGLTTYRYGVARVFLIGLSVLIALAGVLWRTVVDTKYQVPSPRLVAIAKSLISANANGCQDSNVSGLTYDGAHVRRICASPDRVDFFLSPGPTFGGLAYVAAGYVGDPFTAQCAQQLTGPWWRFAEPTPDCSVGWFHPGG